MDYDIFMRGDVPQNWYPDYIFRNFLEEDDPDYSYNSTDIDFIITIKVPGLDKELLKVTTENNIVSVQADWTIGVENFHLDKILRFNDVTADKTTAKLLNGVLTITIPKTGKNLSKQITVK